MSKWFVALLAIAFIATPVAAEISYVVDANGVKMEVNVDDASFETLINSLPEGTRATICLNSITPADIDWYWEIQVTRYGNQVIVNGGFIDGTICDGPNWDVTGGTLTATSLQLNAVYVGVENCADELDMSGTRTPPGPREWTGQYGFPSHFFDHLTGVHNLGPCSY